MLLLCYFWLQEFGELDDSVFDLSIPSLSVTFKSRLHAEKVGILLFSSGFYNRFITLLYKSSQHILLFSGGAVVLSSLADLFNHSGIYLTSF